MNSGQTIITFGSLILLSVAILNLNKFIGESDITLAQSRYRLEALSILTSRIELASQYFFDEASTDTTSEKNLSDFANPSHLGFDSNDDGYVDDFDDFNGITEPDTGRSGVIYNVTYNIDYVKLVGDKFVTSSQREYHKRMTISITDGYADPLLYRFANGEKIRDTLRVSFVHSYWFYN